MGLSRPILHWCVRSAEEMFLSVGGRIGYFQGDPRKLVDDIGELRPTIFIGALLAAAFILFQASASRINS